MKYLIDGYNLLFGIDEHFEELETAREDVIALLSGLLSQGRMRAVCIFDSSHEHSHPFPSRLVNFPNLEVIYSPLGVSADDYIIEYLETNKGPTTLITNDRDLQRRAKQLKVSAQNVHPFLKRLLKKSSKRREEKPLSDSSSNIARYIKEFDN